MAKIVKLCTTEVAGGFQAEGSQRDVVYLSGPIASSYKSPNAGRWGLRGLSQ
jgi:hypothetical protein